MFTINNATLLFVVKLETGTVQASADTIIPLINGQPKSYPNQQKGMIWLGVRLSLLTLGLDFVHIGFIFIGLLIMVRRTKFMRYMLYVRLRCKTKDAFKPPKALASSVN